MNLENIVDKTNDFLITASIYVPEHVFGLDIMRKYTREFEDIAHSKTGLRKLYWMAMGRAAETYELFWRYAPLLVETYVVTEYAQTNDTSVFYWLIPSSAIRGFHLGTGIVRYASRKKIQGDTTLDTDDASSGINDNLNSILENLLEILKKLDGLEEAVRRLDEMLNDERFRQFFTGYRPVTFSDPYSVLGVTPDTPYDEIKGAYRRIAKEFHPDPKDNDPYNVQKFIDASYAWRQIEQMHKSADGDGASLVRDDANTAASQEPFQLPRGKTYGAGS